LQYIVDSLALAALLTTLAALLAALSGLLIALVLLAGLVLTAAALLSALSTLLVLLALVLVHRFLAVSLVKRNNAWDTRKFAVFDMLRQITDSRSLAIRPATPGYRS
jgi:hypothetical protein